MAGMYEIIQALCKERGTNVTAMCKELGIVRSSLSELSRGRSKTLSADKLIKIAGYFGVDPAYLLGEGPKENPAAQAAVDFDDFTYAMHNESRELTEENKQKLLEMAKFFKMQQDKEKT